MGSCFSVSLSCDQMVNQLSQLLCLKESYVHDLAENLKSLEKAMEILKAKRDDVQRRVDREEFTGGKRRSAQVEIWLKNVLTIENQVASLVLTKTVELQRLCLCGFCSKNLKKSYYYGKNVIMMLREVESLGSRGEFDVVTEVVPLAEAEELPIQSTIVGQETLLERVWNRLMEDEVGIVGLYGMGGVGKTTLLTQINNKFTEINGKFDVVIWVVVSNGTTIYKIQGDIAAKLGLGGKEWDQKEENKRALDIHNVLKRRKFVLLLDDIWEKVNLKAVGIPYPNRKNGCKVAFTTRSRDVCGRMGVHHPIEVSCLDPEKSWELFREKVGIHTLEEDPDIRDLARKVAGKCCGLPLALNVIGETMTSKTTVQEWRHAIEVLTSCATEFSGMENDILPLLKYSYDNLSGEQVKSCFLYCALFSEDHIIEKDRLIHYWICEGFIDENEGRERALNQGYEIIGTLVRACLLLENNKWTVSMHDVVREMALWITSDLGKHKDQCVVQAKVGLRKVPKVKNWTVVKVMSLMENMIENIVDSPECPQLRTLFLQNNYNMMNISGEFFRYMPKLLVLDLSMNISLDEIPEEISELVSLRYLDLSETNIKQLPLGLQKLKMLIHLNLEKTLRLEEMIKISNLSNLKIIRLLYSKVMLDMRLMKELEMLEHLEFVSINIRSSMIAEQWFHSSRVGRCIQKVSIRGFPDESTRVLVFPIEMGINLRNIFISSCRVWEVKMENKSPHKSLTSPFFANLSSVSVESCDGLKDLTCLSIAPNLTYLLVSYSKQVETIINKEKSENVSEEPWILIPFRKLETIFLSDLPLLRSIYWTSLPFPCLKKMYVSNCPNLKKLPLNSQSVLKVGELSIVYNFDEDWKESIEWEDEATRLRFLDSFKICSLD